MTGTAEGRELLLKLPEILKQLVVLTQNSSVPISKDAVLALINITGDESGANAMLIISESSNSIKAQENSFNLIEICMR